MIRFIVGILLIFLSGASNGLHETVHYHWSAFERVFPNAEKQYWKPLGDCNDIFKGSWVNKYKDYPKDKSEAFPGSTTVFVFLTDAKHLLSEFFKWFAWIGVYLIVSSAMLKTKYNWLLIPMGCYIVHSIGFHLIYTLIF